MKKRILALLMTATMVLSMATTAFAAEGKGTITSNDAGHTYEIYQILTGTVAPDGTIENPVYGADAVGTAGDAVSPTDMAALKVIAEAGDKTDDQVDIATMKPYVNIDGEPFEKVDADNNSVEVPTGYYLIVDTWTNGDPLEEDALSLYMFKTITEEGLTITPKKSTPEHEKKVDDVNDTNPDGAADNKKNQDSADYDIGDEVPFHLTAKLDNNIGTAGYKKYHITFVDTMEAGLTNCKDYVVKINGTETTDYVVTNESDRGFELTLTWEAEKDADGKYLENSNLASLNGAVITVDFHAILNEDAVIGTPGNQNKSQLKYSNNPNLDQDGKPDEGEGETPEDEVFVFTYKLTADKVNGNGDALDGAGFTLYKKVAGSENTVDGLGKGYEPVGEEQQGPELHNFEWKGLDDGEYVLVETTVPAGYNKAPNVEFKITASHVADCSSTEREAVLESVTVNNEKVSPKMDETTTNGWFDTQVVNNSGVILPSTGGMGTTIIYVLGGILLAGAAIVLVTKKRMAQ